MILDFINSSPRELKENALTFWTSFLSFPTNVGGGPYIIAYSYDNNVRIENCTVEYSTDSYTTSNNISITLSDNSFVWTI